MELNIGWVVHVVEWFFRYVQHENGFLLCYFKSIYLLLLWKEWSLLLKQFKIIVLVFMNAFFRFTPSFVYINLYVHWTLCKLYFISSSNLDFFVKIFSTCDSISIGYKCFAIDFFKLLDILYFYEISSIWILELFKFRYCILKNWMKRCKFYHHIEKFNYIIFFIHYNIIILLYFQIKK